MWFLTIPDGVLSRRRRDQLQSAPAMNFSGIFIGVYIPSSPSSTEIINLLLRQRKWLYHVQLRGVGTELAGFGYGVLEIVYCSNYTLRISLSLSMVRYCANTYIRAILSYSGPFLRDIACSRHENSPDYLRMPENIVDFHWDSIVRRRCTFSRRYNQ
ncbi:hypothetical protein PM082_021697 [Marasmius tenuissimus]|nr:hypothetical protein PM082_021697 [Marasmius tenuissimus]